MKSILIAGLGLFLTFAAANTLSAQADSRSDSLQLAWTVKYPDGRRIPDGTVVEIFVGCKCHFYTKQSVFKGKLGFKVLAKDVATCADIFLGFRDPVASNRRLLYSACVWGPIKRNQKVRFRGPRDFYINCI